MFSSSRDPLIPGPDLLKAIYLGELSLGPQDPRGPPANCGPHRVSCRYKMCSINIRQQFVITIHEM